MNVLKETAPAKVNLTLKVRGRRPDGYHELSSLAAFAHECDELELKPGGGVSMTVSGPFIADLDTQDNLVVRAACLVMERCPGTGGGAFRLDKRLPVSAGLGGGSADAAAVLRLMERANPGQVARETIGEIARELGADVTVCLQSTPAFMSGRGDEISPTGAFPALPAVLVNPGVALEAGDVYAALDAPPLGNARRAQGDTVARFSSADDLIGYIEKEGNDLEPVAERLVPVVADVREALSATKGCLLAQMSGSGPTCFGIYRSDVLADAAAQSLTKAHPGWWVCATKIG